MKHIDPVCGMVIKEGTAKGSLEYKGKIYYFCSIECLEEFKKNPEKHLKEGSTHKMTNK
jgi:YHS domain-containing protein